MKVSTMTLSDVGPADLRQLATLLRRPRDRELSEASQQVSDRQDLRPAILNSVIERALLALSQWSGLKEGDPAAAPLLSEYWSAVPGFAADTAPSVPWSAAFISWVCTPLVSPAASHVQYAREAARARRDRQEGYWTFKPAEVTAVLAGDLLLRARSGSGLTYADLDPDGGHASFFASHADLVVASSLAAAVAIGGNKGNTVGTEAYPLSNGKPDSSIVAILRYELGS